MSTEIVKIEKLEYRAIIKYLMYLEGLRGILDMALHKVFVYGTLKTGEPNHHVFANNVDGCYKLLCKAVTSQKYPLILGTKFNIPFLLHKPGTGYNVKGELYEVDNKVLAVLDELEDHPNFYIREQSDVISSTDSSIHKAWIYFIKNFQKHLLENEMMDCYSNNGSLPKYVERYLRRGQKFNYNEVLSK